MRRDRGWLATRLIAPGLLMLTGLAALLGAWFTGDRDVTWPIRAAALVIVAAAAWKLALVHTFVRQRCREEG